MAPTGTTPAAVDQDTHLLHPFATGAACAFDISGSLARRHVVTQVVFDLPEIEVLGSDWSRLGDDLWLAMIKTIDALPADRRENLQKRLNLWAERVSEQFLSEVRRLADQHAHQLRFDLHAEAQDD